MRVHLPSAVWPGCAPDDARTQWITTRGLTSEQPSEESSPTNTGTVERQGSRPRPGQAVDAP
jgi:hypothetical protein